MFVVTVSGNSAMSPDGLIVATWNLYNGIDLFQLFSPLRLTRTLALPDNFSDNNNVALDLEFIDDGSHLLVGSSTGKPCIIDLSSGNKDAAVVQILEHSVGASPILKFHLTR